MVTATFLEVSYKGILWKLKIHQINYYSRHSFTKSIYKEKCSIQCCNAVHPSYSPWLSYMLFSDPRSLTVYLQCVSSDQPIYLCNLKKYVFSLNIYLRKCPKIRTLKFLKKMVYVNSADPNQTAHDGAVCSGSTLFAIPLSIIRYNYEKQILIPKVKDKVFKILEHLS